MDTYLTVIGSFLAELPNGKKKSVVQLLEVKEGVSTKGLLKEMINDAADQMGVNTSEILVVHFSIHPLTIGGDKPW